MARGTRLGLLAAAAALRLAAPAFADDSPMSLYGGSARVMDEDRVQISMDSETVLMSLGRGGYDVRVTFSFFNHGASTTVPVGFPVVAPTGFKGGPDPITDFATWADGRRLTVRTLESSRRDAAKYAPPGALRDVSAVPQALRWLVADIPFAAGRATAVRVRYRAEYDPEPPWTTDAHYLFGTGAAWEGPIGSALFVVDRESGTDIPVVGFSGVGAAKPEVLRLGQATSAYRFSKIEPPPTASLEIHFPSEDRQEDAARDPDGEERPAVPDYSSWRFAREPVKDADLEGLTYPELRIFRNAFFAGHGRVFADKSLQEFFQHYVWYSPRSDFRESDLSAVEAANVRKILQREKRYETATTPGGPFDLGELLYPVSAGHRVLDDVERGDAAALSRDLAPLRAKEDGAYLLPPQAPLVAARAGRAEALKALLDSGADPDVFDGAAFREAACAGADQALDVLLASGARVGEKTFQLWRCEGPSAHVRHGGRDRAPFQHGASWMKLLTRFAQDQDALRSDGGRLLAQAAQAGWTEGIEFLLERGAADPGEALSQAARDGDLPLVRLLDARGARKAALNNALLEALLNDHREVAAEMIARGADVNAEDSSGRTPLIAAAWSDDPQTIFMLLEKGADPAAKNREGRTALAEAEQRGRERSVAALRAWSAGKRPAAP